jgi:hypothetical protein
MKDLQRKIEMKVYKGKVKSYEQEQHKIYIREQTKKGKCGTSNFGREAAEPAMCCHVLQKTGKESDVMWLSIAQIEGHELCYFVKHMTCHVM